MAADKIGTDSKLKVKHKHEGKTVGALGLGEVAS